jgi:hypothetical protein
MSAIIDPIQKEESKLSEAEVVSSGSPTESEAPPLKKQRKPFVFTDKRKEAFERCRQRREEKAKEKRASGLYKYQVQEYMSKLKAANKYKKIADELNDTNEPILPSSPSAYITHRQTHEPLDCVPTAATTLTIPTTHPNLPPITEPPKLSMEATASMATSNSVSTEPVQTTMSNVSVLQVTPQMLQSQSSKSLPVDDDEEMDTHDSYQQRMQAPQQVQVQVQQESRKRKVQFSDTPSQQHELVGAGNHPSFEENDMEEEEDEDSPPQMYYQNVIDPSKLNDDELVALLSEAKARLQQRSMYDTRRETGKQRRPSQASLFLDTVGGAHTTHPSQLFSNHNLHQTAKPRATGHLVWL